MKPFAKIVVSLSLVLGGLMAGAAPSSAAPSVVSEAEAIAACLNYNTARGNSLGFYKSGIPYLTDQAWCWFQRWEYIGGRLKITDTFVVVPA